jgi:hypothetical protein
VAVGVSYFLTFEEMRVTSTVTSLNTANKHHQSDDHSARPANSGHWAPVTAAGTWTLSATATLTADL